MAVRSVLGGVGLLVVLVTVATLGVLGARVLDSTEMVASPADAHGAAPGSDTDAMEAPPELEGVTRPGIDAAGAAQCDVDRRTVETAARAYEVMHSSPPDSQQALVANGLLVAIVVHVDVTVMNGQLVVAGTGPCAP